MGLVTELEKEEIRSRVPLEELVRDYNVHLIPAGRHLKALCPFHQEKTPSFYVYPESQVYKCYGCQESGDLFKFVQQMDRVGFMDAVEILARRAGVVLRRDPVDARNQGRRVQLYDALGMAARYYHELLLRDPRAGAAREYLERRRLRRESWERFQLGYSLPSWEGLLEEASRQGVAAQVLEGAGLAGRRRQPAPGRESFDVFRGRLMFPITDVQNRVIGFGARTLGDETPKYVNTAKSVLFDKSSVLYGLAQAKTGIRRRGEVAIVEGYTDVIMAHQEGLDHFVGSLGTAFTEENARRLRRLAERVLLVFDGDAAGQSASERSLDLLAAGELDVRVASVSPGKDPCDALLELGGETFRRELESRAVSLFEFKWRRTVGSLGPASTPAARSRAVDEFLRLVARLRNPVGRQLVLRDYAERLGVGEREVQERLQLLSGATAARTRAALGARETPSGGETPGNERLLEPLAELVLECLLAVPHRAREIAEQIPEGLFRGPVGEVLWRAVMARADSGTLSAARLAAEVDDPAAQRVVVGLLGRLEGERWADRVAPGDGGTPRDAARDYELVWRNCQRDLRRWALRARLRELEGLKAQARVEEDSEAYRKYRSEYSRLLKELKR